MAFCGGCGAGLRDGARFCATCGQPTTAPSAKTVPGKVPIPVRPPAPAPAPAAPARATNRTPLIVAVLGVLAVVIGVTVGLVITSSDESESADAADSSNGGTSDSGDSSEDDGDSGDGGSDSEPTFSEDVSFTLNNGDGTFAPGEPIVLSPSYGSGSGIDHVELFIDGRSEASFDPGEEISTTLPEGNHRLRLIVHPVEGPQVRSGLERIVVEEDVLGNPSVPDNLRAIANRYSNALANGNWAVARSMNASLAGKTDAEFQADWGDIDAQFVVPVRLEGPGVLRLGLVVHQLYDIETGTGGPRTSLFCNTWTINSSTGTLSAEAGFRPSFQTYPAYTDPAELEDTLVNNC